ncbi:hypothetical protein [Myceligenerans xiligouense]|uniref:Uncharacterized protein n=1 Tax=Myceligenerans xiligouense TaxID=253184 RepID=A0A3N4YSD2_9MICO|nr:hypothetical protein [Myceligenerans xiligouense]RPF23137.1 hypothetical protein EDD34_3818 [Myceligenerans xiligouense]
MNSNLPERDDADFLSGALRGAADAMPGGEAKEMHLQFGVVRDRVHRRRATKIGGIGVTALAVTGGLAVGAAQLSMFDDEALLPANPSPSDSTVEPGPVAEDTVLNGYLPAEIYENTGLYCGAGAESIGRAAGAARVVFEGPPYAAGEGDAATAYVGLELPALSRSGGDALDLEPAAVWIRDGRIVSLSRYFDPEPPQVTYDASGLARTDIRLDTVNACDPPEGAEDAASDEPVVYEQVLAAGEYQVVPVLWTDITAGAADYVTGEPMAVEVLPDGRVATE